MKRENAQFVLERDGKSNGGWWMVDGGWGMGLGLGDGVSETAAEDLCFDAFLI